jgi:cytochrome c biogenesis protein CcmG, thiol:disulfide interchange protein DsbE
VSARAFAVFIVALALVALLGFGLVARGGDNLAPGDPVPDAELPRLDGEGTGSIADLRGKWVLVNFWASWCDPCRDEAPALQDFYERHGGDRFVVLGIDSQDLSGDALGFVDEFGLTYPMLRDAEGERFDEFGITGLPESFLVDPNGGVSLIRRGPVDGEYLERYVAPKLEGE